MFNRNLFGLCQLNSAIVCQIHLELLLSLIIYDSFSVIKHDSARYIIVIVSESECSMFIFALLIINHLHHKSLLILVVTSNLKLGVSPFSIVLYENLCILT